MTTIQGYASLENAVSSTVDKALSWIQAHSPFADVSAHQTDHGRRRFMGGGVCAAAAAASIPALEGLMAEEANADDYKDIEEALKIFQETAEKFSELKERYGTAVVVALLKGHRHYKYSAMQQRVHDVGDVKVEGSIDDPIELMDMRSWGPVGRNKDLQLMRFSYHEQAEGDHSGEGRLGWGTITLESSKEGLRIGLNGFNRGWGDYSKVPFPEGWGDHSNVPLPEGWEDDRSKIPFPENWKGSIQTLKSPFRTLMLPVDETFELTPEGVFRSTYHDGNFQLTPLTLPQSTDLIEFVQRGINTLKHEYHHVKKFDTAISTGFGPIARFQEDDLSVYCGFHPGLAAIITDTQGNVDEYTVGSKIHSTPQYFVLINEGGENEVYAMGLGKGEPISKYIISPENARVIEDITRDTFIARERPQGSPLTVRALYVHDGTLCIGIPHSPGEGEYVGDDRLDLIDDSIQKVPPTKKDYASLLKHIEALIRPKLGTPGTAYGFDPRPSYQMLAALYGVVEKHTHSGNEEIPAIKSNETSNASNVITGIGIAAASFLAGAALGHLWATSKKD